MKNRIVFLILVLLSLCFLIHPVLGQSSAFGGVNTGKVATSDPFMGDWEGQWSSEVTETDPMIVAQVIPRGSDRYQIRILAEFDQRAVPYLDVTVKAVDGVIKFEKGAWSGELRGEIFRGKGEFKNAKGPFEMKKVTRLSPTIGKKPPKKAIVLFDGSGFEEWEASGRAADEIQWKIVNGAMQIFPFKTRTGRHALRTKRKFLDCRLHIEFRLPLEPENSGQGRGNSGIMLNGYELQVLDSYGLEGYYNECGSLYKVAAPMVNMCAPPLQWQTFDITFFSPRFDTAGKKVNNARMTVLHNGKLIHKNQEIPHHTSNSQKGRLGEEPKGPGTISLQNHSHPVEFRNIWVVDLSKQ